MVGMTRNPVVTHRNTGGWFSEVSLLWIIDAAAQRGFLLGMIE